ncbi:MAG: glycosyltransferase family 4 protein [Magnetococcales bacterium]|nr:glycosyltransferase family 4 protein [Magnetococcales bacterium]MBF0438856.1 glycosyltransferase family 4 protein [Magnetococcales bacterium]
MLPSRIALSWSIGQFHGWGIYGLNLVFAMLRHDIQPLLLRLPSRLALQPLEMRALLPVLEHSQEAITFPQRAIRAPETVLLHHTNGEFVFPLVDFHGQTTIGITFFETTELSSASIAQAQTMPLVVTGSRWNAGILQEKYGLTNIACLMQGIDSTLFFPSGTRGLLSGRFVIFSGGKLEFRKGQDLVIAAFQRFYARHPDAFLLTAWNNSWLSPSARFSDRWVSDMPENNDINAWLGQYLPENAFMDVGEVPNPMMPTVLREAHVGLFPNRCEGGTNLVAMECMAMGLPVILSDNTGHRDLLDEERCYPLTRQDPCMQPNSGALLIDWGESSVDEIVTHLEAIYSNRQEAVRRGVNASHFIREFSWNRQCDQLLGLVADAMG